jgi:CD109 antigen
VSAYPVLWLGSVQPFIQNNIVRKVSRVEDGSTFLDFDIRSELNIIGDFERFVNIEAIFEEDFTGRTQNSSNQVSIHKFNYKLEVVKVSETFKPGLPFYATAKVENFDGTPVNDLNNPVTIYPMFSPKESSNGNFTKYFLNSKGMVDFEVLIPPQATYFNLKVRQFSIFN